MMSFSRLVISVGVVVASSACGSSEPGMDWSKKPLDVTLESKVHGQAFRVSIPNGMTFDGHDTDKESDPELTTKEWRVGVKRYFNHPSIMVSNESIPAQDLDGYVKDAMLEDDDIVAKKAALPDGFVLVNHTRDFGQVYVHVMKRKGDVALECTASQAKKGGVPSPQATLAWLEKVCSSLTIL